MKGGDIGVIGQRHTHAALAEGLLDPLEDGAVKALDLLRGRLAAKEAADLGAVVPGLRIACGDAILQRVRTVAKIDKGIDGCRRGRRCGSRGLGLGYWRVARERKPRGSARVQNLDLRRCGWVVTAAGGAGRHGRGGRGGLGAGAGSGAACCPAK